MRTANAMQLKARVNKKAREAGVPPQALMQNYLIERLLVRISKSRWCTNVVVKGGMLISSLVGVAARTTMDLDTTVRGFDLTHASAESLFREVIKVPSDDDWTFVFDRTEDIRETDDYPGIRVHLKAVYPPMAVPLAIDVTTGDKITPAPVLYDYPLLFDDGMVKLMAYPLETVLAEKIETVISRGIVNTRPRDFYDIRILWALYGKDCDLETLCKALDATCGKRGSAEAMAKWERVLEEVKADRRMLAQWAKYARNNPYVADISLEECCDVVHEIVTSLAKR